MAGTLYDLSFLFPYYSFQVTGEVTGEQVTVAFIVLINDLNLIW